MSLFDPDSFMNTTVNSQFDTEYPTLPDGEYVAAITNIKSKVLDDGRVVLEVSWKVDNPELEDQLGPNAMNARQSIWLDITPSGGLDTGRFKNQKLGQLREATGQNKPGGWAPGNLIGSVAMIKTFTKDGYVNVKAVRAV